MNVVALTCKRCGGTLPSPGGGSPFVTCSFCGTSHAVSAPAIAITLEKGGPSEFELRQAAAGRAWDAARASSKDPVVALRAVVAETSHELKTEQELERAARLAEGLAHGFDAENGVELLSDKTATIRMAEASVKAIIELRSVEQTSVNLPFLMANEKGPKHLDQRVTRAKLVELDAMGTYVVREAPAPAAPKAPAPVADASTPKKKRSWWQF